MPIAAPAPPQLPTVPPVPAQVSTAFAKNMPAMEQDWFEAVRAAPALNAPSITTPAVVAAQSSESRAGKAMPDAAAQTLSKVAPSRMAKMWEAIQRRLPQPGTQAPAKTVAEAAPEAAAKTAPKPVAAQPQFSKLRVLTDGFAKPQASSPADLFTSQASPGKATPTASPATTPKSTTPLTPQDWGATSRQAPALSQTPAAAPAQFSKLRTPTNEFAKPQANNPAALFTSQASPGKATPAARPAAAPRTTTPLTPQDWGATPRQAPALGKTPAAAPAPAPASPTRSLTEGQAPLRQAPSLASQVGLFQAAPLQGTTPRTPQDWGATPRQAPDIHAPVKTIDIPLDRTQPPAKSPALYVPINSVIDAQRPDKLVGSSINTSVPLGKDSPVLPGGKLVIKAANVDTTRPGEIRSPQIDIVAVDQKGGAQGHIRINRDTNAVTGSIHLGDGRRDLVFTGTANPVNGSATAVQVTGISDDIGLRVVLNNPGGAQTPAGKPGPQGKRVEVLVAPEGGAFVRNGPNLRKPVEVYVFAAKSGTPGSAATTGSEGAGIRFSDLKISPQGEVPVVGSAQIEVARQHGTNARGQAVKGDGQIGVTVSADLKIGKEGGVQGFIEPSVTVNPTADRPFSLSGFLGILIPFR